MFDGPDFPQPLDEELFDSWLESGRTHKIRYSHLLVIWNEFDSKYLPFYIESLTETNEYELYGSASGQESLIAVYDLYSESRVNIHR